MRDLFSVKVECRSEYKADERPVRFYLDNIRFEIDDIIDRWYQGDLNPDIPPANYFKVLTADKKIYILKHVIQKDEWYLWIRGEKLNL